MWMRDASPLGVDYVYMETQDKVMSCQNALLWEVSISRGEKPKRDDSDFVIVVNFGVCVIFKLL